LFLILVGVDLLLLQVWPALEKYRVAFLFAALGVACLVNVAVNRAYHCAITGPFFLLVAGVLTLRAAGLWEISISGLWPIVLIVVGFALVLEWRRAGRAT
jgi:hypothetical protein